ncbi:MAG: photosynthetic reaction center cytochrome c subunit family protein, partial [Gemmatimonadota bacterium]|nr:photosynthetic reaction center cytochrome c subunit family protein [Gemmatimonadota bacterium]
MSDRVPAGVAAVSSLLILAYACTTPPGGSTTPSPASDQRPATTATGAVTTAQRPRVPLTDSARRVRDSLTAARRDSGEATLLRQIAGRENLPAESVFKNIEVMKGIPAGRFVRIMNAGFSRSLGVSCGFCHVPGKWDLDDKKEKETARLMWTMTHVINRDYIAKVPVDSGPPPMVVC